MGPKDVCELDRSEVLSQTLNHYECLVSGIMVLVICWSIAILAFRKDLLTVDRQIVKSTVYSLGFWLVWWIELLVVYSAPELPYWQMLVIDGCGCVCIVGCAAFMLPGSLSTPLIQINRRQLFASTVAALGTLVIWPFLLVAIYLWGSLYGVEAVRVSAWHDHFSVVVYSPGLRRFKPVLRVRCANLFGHIGLRIHSDSCLLRHNRR